MTQSGKPLIRLGLIGAARCESCYEPTERSHQPIVTVTFTTGQTGRIDLVHAMQLGKTAAMVAAVAPTMLATAREQAALYRTCAERQVERARQQRPDYATPGYPTATERAALSTLGVATDLVDWLKG